MNDEQQLAGQLAQHVVEAVRNATAVAVPPVPWVQRIGPVLKLVMENNLIQHSFVQTPLYHTADMQVKLAVADAFVAICREVSTYPKTSVNAHIHGFLVTVSARAGKNGTNVVSFACCILHSSLRSLLLFSRFGYRQHEACL